MSTKESMKDIVIEEPVSEKQDVAVRPEVKSDLPEKPPVKLGPAEVNAILDAIFTRGYYEEEVELPRGHKCVLSTRSIVQAKEILERLERDNPNRLPRYNQLYSFYCLAASLKSLDGKSISNNYDEKIKIIEQWPGPLADILLDKLVEFDDKVASAHTDEQVKN